MARRTSAAVKGFSQPSHPALRHEGLGLGAEAIPRDDNEPLAELRRVLLQRPVEAGPVELWHAQVTEDQVIGALLELRQGQPAVGRRVHAVAVAAQQRRQRFDHGGFVIHQQNGEAGDGGSRPPLSLAPRRALMRHLQRGRVSRSRSAAA